MRQMTDKKFFNIMLVCIIAVMLIFFCADNISRNGGFFGKKNQPVLTEELRELFSTRPAYGLGINKELKGKITVQIFFVDDDESNWDAESISLFMKPIKEGLRFIEKQADRYGVELEFEIQYHASTVSGEKDKLRYKGSVLDGSDGTHTHDMMEQLADNFGYYSTRQLYESYKYQSGGREVVFVAVVNKDGISTARQQQSADYGGDYVEHAIIFTNYIGRNLPLDKKSDRASTVAHEVMHLFGAPDLYIKRTVERYTSYKYPKDIMLGDTDDMRRLEVCEYTAYTVGWVDAPPELE